MHSFEARELIVHDDGDRRDVWLCVNDRSSHRCCLCMLVVVGAWALAHHAAVHLSEQTDLGRQHPGEFVPVQILGWGAREQSGMTAFQ